MSIILRPLLTEQSTKSAEGGKFTFEVAPHATKDKIAKVVQETFGVTVKSVHTMRTAGKTRRFGRFVKTSTGKKKAIVRLKEGQTIDLFTTEKSTKSKHLGGLASGRKVGNKK
ncbi:50S ribosomal protein L23 [Candidatus Microgenomates bacterium]|nr:50S ribosomal protein L23 [Candidatus Microgenomates bacterium]